MRQGPRKTRVLRRAPIGPDHYDIARGFIDAWLGELEISTFRRLQREAPEMSSDQLHASSIVIDYDGRWIWVSIAGSLKFVIEKKTGQILGVVDIKISTRQCYGDVRWWDQLDWSTDPPRLT
jgi:hypothetical protein